MARPKSKLKVPNAVIKSIPIIADIIVDAYTRKRHEEVGLKSKPKPQSPPPLPEPEGFPADTDR